MDKMKAFLLVTVLVAAAAFGSTGLAAYASGNGSENGTQYGKVRQEGRLEFTKCQGPLPWSDGLTDEQRETINQIVENMKASGASWEEIKVAVDAKLQEWGIEIPEFYGPFTPRLGELTEEQREEIKQIVSDMSEAGADREEIKAAIDAKLDEWGIKAPEFQGSPHMGQLSPRPLDLTDERREIINQIIEDMKDTGASGEEIRDAVAAQLQEWGIEVPEFQGPPHMGQFRHNREYGNGIPPGQGSLHMDQFCPQNDWGNGMPL